MSTLLEKARSAPVGDRRFTTMSNVEERLELTLAYVRRDITGTQMCAALGMEKRFAGNIYNFIAKSLSDAIRAGLLVRSDQ